MRIGVDIGGTKIEVAALDAAGNTPIRQRVETPHHDYRATVAAVRDLISKVEGEIGGRAKSIGISMPGSISPVTGLVKNSPNAPINGHPFDNDLESALGGRSLRFANDANCLALSESVDGAGKGLTVVFGVILGTGVGGGIIVRGKMITGHNNIAGEWGHSPLPVPRDDERHGPLCACGQSGHIEAFLSGRALTRDHLAATGESLDPPEIEARAKAGDGPAEATLARYEDRLARALATVINLLDPDGIVLGGGLGNMDRLYLNVPKLWGSHVYSDFVTTPLLKPKWGDSSGVRGAALLWERGEGVD
jgi:fructokinase